MLSLCISFVIDSSEIIFLKTINYVKDIIKMTTLFLQLSLITKGLQECKNRCNR